SDLLRQASHARPQGTDAPHDQVDRHPGLTGPVQRVDHLFVHNRVDLDDDRCRIARFGQLRLAFDALDDARSDAMRRHQQPAVAGLPAVTGQYVEQVGQIRTDLGVGREQTEVLVDPGSLGVVVTGTDVTVPADCIALLAYHHRSLAMGLEPDQAIHHVT